MENKMCSKPQYKCGVCDKIYDSIAERMKCEAACLKRIEIEEKRAAEAKKKEEQAARKAKVDKMLAEAYKERDEYVRDYGTYSYVHEDEAIKDWAKATVGDIFKIFM